MKTYTVYWIGNETGRKDGEIIKEFTSEAKAIAFARKTLKECGDEFDGCAFGGIGIDCDGKPVEW